MNRLPEKIKLSQLYNDLLLSQHILTVLLSKNSNQNTSSVFLWRHPFPGECLLKNITYLIHPLVLYPGFRVFLAGVKLSLANIKFQPVQNHSAGLITKILFTGNSVPCWQVAKDGFSPKSVCLERKILFAGCVPRSHRSIDDTGQ